MSDDELRKRLDKIDSTLGGIVMFLAVIGILFVFTNLAVWMK